MLSSGWCGGLRTVREGNREHRGSWVSQGRAFPDSGSRCDADGKLKRVTGQGRSLNLEEPYYDWVFFRLNVVGDPTTGAPARRVPGRTTDGAGSRGQSEV